MTSAPRRGRASAAAVGPRALALVAGRLAWAAGAVRRCGSWGGGPRHCAPGRLRWWPSGRQIMSLSVYKDDIIDIRYIPYQ